MESKSTFLNDRDAGFVDITSDRQLFQDSDPDLNIAASYLVYKQETYPILKLDEYGFVLNSLDISEGDENSGVLEGKVVDAQDRALDIQFRVRSRSEENVRCSFYELSLEHKKVIKEIMELIKSKTLPDNAIHQLSYDELASGLNMTKTKEQAKTLESDNSPTRANPRELTVSKKAIGSGFKSLVALLMISGILGIMVVVFYLSRSNYRIQALNASILENDTMVYAPYKGSILEVKHLEGDEIKIGEVLAVVQNVLYQEEYARKKLELIKAEQEVAAYNNTIINYLGAIKIVQKKIEQQIEIAQHSVDKANFDLEVAVAQVQRLEPLKLNNNLPLADYEKAQAQKSSLEMEVKKAKAILESYKSDRSATDQEILVSAEKIDTSIYKTRENLELSRANLEVLKHTVELARIKAEPYKIKAPHSGKIQVIYHTESEVVDIDDVILSVSKITKERWAAGNITYEDSMNIKPGQKVEVSVPSMGLTTIGEVVSLGHDKVDISSKKSREILTGYVPVKVVIPNKLSDIPSGVRVSMCIRLNENFVWFDEQITKFQNGVTKFVSEKMLGKAADAVEDPAKVGDKSSPTTEVAEGPELKTVDSDKPSTKAEGVTTP